MSLSAFENGYWYHTELEPAIKAYLRTGRLPRTVGAKPLKKGPRDLDAGLSLRLKIGNYTSNRETKDFLRRSARKKGPRVPHLSMSDRMP